MYGHPPFDLVEASKPRGQAGHALARGIEAAGGIAEAMRRS
jgi:hypothetical protein